MFFLVLRTMLTSTRPALRIRATTRADAGKYRSILERSSADDRYRRFFTHVDTLDPAIVEASVEPRPDGVGLIAERLGVPLGVVNGVIDETGRGELSLIVARDARRRGVGRDLFLAAIAALRERGCREFVAYSLGDNYEFAQLARSAGMRPGSCEAGVCSWHIDAPGEDRLEQRAVGEVA